MKKQSTNAPNIRRNLFRVLNVLSRIFVLGFLIVLCCLVLFVFLLIAAIIFHIL